MAMKMLRWTAGVTRKDRIRKKFGVAPIADEMHEGHVLRGKEDSVRKIEQPLLEDRGELPDAKILENVSQGRRSHWIARTSSAEALPSSPDCTLAHFIRFEHIIFKF
ncbi:unnamed protein product [Heligmosomoides polygyrus]|uniref:Uncharacterized protein n=1 Tax=Heligmosomoides polygyrus TaxID=6339 RepID=A0A3P8BGB7_HELPZ|nr:unnamed protein product [Heligmosomoides polygyrus]